MLESSWFRITSGYNWLKNLAPLFAPRQLHVFTSIFDWFTGLSLSFDWLERLSKVLVLLHYIENHNEIISNITITGLVL